MKKLLVKLVLTLLALPLVFTINEREFKAIKSLHAAMDDDDDGIVDINESKDFLTKDLSYSHNSASNARLKAFHASGTDDQIDVNELWRLWHESPVRNWTTDEMIEWLIEDVGCAEYAKHFRENLINGTHLPQIAAESGYLTSLNIASSLHKFRLKTKAKDVVLFGPPQRNGYSGQLFMMIVTVALASCGITVWSVWMKRAQERQYQSELESIRKDERELQDSLRRLSEQNRHLSSHKSDLEQQLQLQRQSSASNLSMGSSLDLAGTGSVDGTATDNHSEQITALRNEVIRLERALHSKKWTPSRKMLLLLLESYKQESWLLQEWRRSVEEQAAKARVGLQKLEKRRTTLWGVYKIAQNAPAEESKQLVLDAKQAIETWQEKFKERQARWEKIQDECNYLFLAT